MPFYIFIFIKLTIKLNYKIFNICNLEALNKSAIVNLQS